MQHFEKLEAKTALKRRSTISSWANAKERLRPAAWPALTPSFKIASGAKVFTIGSCFARNVEEHLSLLGCELPTLDFSVPSEEWTGLRRNGILNKYTPATVCQEIEWAAAILKRGEGFKPEDAQEMRFDLADGQVIDLHLGSFIPVSFARFIERRAEIYALYTHAFEADLVSLTFGLTESWQENDTGLHIHQAPTARQLMRAAPRFDFVNIDYEGSLGYMQRAVDALRDLNPTASIIVTISPVPLNTTFSGQDIITANMLSKATLRSAVGKLEKLYDNLDYFPSFESALHSPMETAYAEDLRHIQDGFVGRIVEHLIHHYFEAPCETDLLLQKAAATLGADRGHPAFLELAEHAPDVTSLSDDQLNVYLRSSWQVKDKKTIKRLAKEIMKRDVRIHRHLRAIAHIFPRCGLADQLRCYANEVLAQDPQSPLALRCLNAA
jgi:hypothetical protein